MGAPQAQLLQEPPATLAGAVPGLRLFPHHSTSVDAGTAVVTSTEKHQSPSLNRRSAGLLPAHEMKLLLSEEQARDVEHRLRPLLALDPHADAAAGDAYQLSTLYCDTPALAVYHRQGRFRLFKFRLRRYGSSSQVYLERKAKQGTRVRKQRLAVPLGQLDRFQHLAADTLPAKWSEADAAACLAAARYFRQLLRQQLQPVCMLNYNRVAYFAHGDCGAIRLTFDRQIRGGLASGWSFATPHRCQPLMANQVVCELKFRGPMPTMFKSVLHAMQLVPTGLSKYRQCLQACGHDQAVGGNASSGSQPDA